MRFSQILAKFAVSLFTRERIEIDDVELFKTATQVSLFTRERIEIAVKLGSSFGFPVSLFTRERIEILGGVRSAELSISLPLYEGAD